MVNETCFRSHRLENSADLVEGPTSVSNEQSAHEHLLHLAEDLSSLLNGLRMILADLSVSRGVTSEQDLSEKFKRISLQPYIISIYL